MSEFVATHTQWHGLVLMSMVDITTRKFGNVLGGSSSWEPPGGPGAVHNWTQPSLDTALEREEPVSHPGSTVDGPDCGKL